MNEDDWQRIADEIRWSVNAMLKNHRWRLCRDGVWLSPIRSSMLCYPQGAIHMIPDHECRKLVLDGRFKEELETIAAIAMVTQ